MNSNQQYMIQYAATRGEGDYWRKVRLASGGKDVVREVEGEKGGVRDEIHLFFPCAGSIQGQIVCHGGTRRPTHPGRPAGTKAEGSTDGNSEQRDG